MSRAKWIFRAAIFFAVVRIRNSSRNLVSALCLAIACCTSVAAAADGQDSLQLLGRGITPGTASKFSFLPDQTFETSYLNMPAFVAGGVRTAVGTGGFFFPTAQLGVSVEPGDSPGSIVDPMTEYPSKSSHQLLVR